MVSAAPREKLLQRLGHHGGDRPPRHPGMLTHPLRKTSRHLDREHRRRLRNHHGSRPGRDLRVAAGLTLRAAEPPGKHPGRLSHRNPRRDQPSGRVDALGVLHATHPATTRHVTNVLPDLSHVRCNTPRPLATPVAQRHLKAEVATCVGGALSPLLANIALSVLDEHLTGPWKPGGAMSTPGRRAVRRRKGQPSWRVVRYADDFVGLVDGCRSDVTAVHEEIATVLAPLGLRLSPAKTRIVHMSEGFDFLGFRIQWRRKRGTNQWYVYTFIADRPLKAVKAKIRAMTHRVSQADPRTILA